MRVLLVSQYYPPEVGATQNRMQSFATALRKAGVDVDVLTELPNHPAGVIPTEFDGRWFDIAQIEGCRVVRVRVATSPKKTYWSRLAFYASFALMALAARPRLARRYDVVLATSPPLPAAGAGWLLARWTRAQFVLDVRDLWPKAAVALGELSQGAAYRAAERLEARLYRDAARILLTTRGFADDLGARGVAAAKLAYVPNGADLDNFSPRAPTLRDALANGAETLVVYAGLHGIAQDLDTVLSAASQLRDVRAKFVFLGDGPRKAALVARARELALTNVDFHDAVPVERCADYLSAADLVVVPLAANPLFTMFVPSKLYDAMACARPVLLMVDGEARDILRRAEAGVFVPPGNATALADAIRRLARAPAECRKMGESGRTFVVEHFSREAIGREVVGIVEEVAGSTARSVA